MAKRAFGELEIQIIHIMKDGGRLTVKDVHRRLGGEDNYNTIMTVMNRLAEKKQLFRERMGLQYEYWLGDAKKQIPSILEKFKQKFMGVETAALVSYLVESDDTITDEELSEMEKLIQKAKSKRKKE